MTRPLSAQRGFTLIELIVFIVVVSIGIAGILSVMDTSIRNSADPMVRKQATSVAESLLGEILLKAFQDPAGGTNGVSTCALGAGSNRGLWDDVCDYNSYTSTGIKDSTGASVGGLGSYNVTPAIAVSTVTVNSVSMKKVVVSVTDPQGNTVSVTGYRGNY